MKNSTDLDSVNRPFVQMKIGDKIATAQIHARAVNMAAFPVLEKRPASDAGWKAYANVPGVSGTVAEWQRATGYALAPVKGSSAAIIDCDDPQLARTLIARIPRLRETFQTQRADHMHYYVQLASAPTQSIYSLIGEAGEAASLRCYGAYVVGPESDHPTGQQYRHTSGKRPIILTPAETAILFTIFTTSAKTQAEQTKPNEEYAEAIDTAAAIFRQRGYKQRGQWLNGQCIHPENHRAADAHRSAGYNTQSGVFHCFVCGEYSIAQVCAALDIQQPEANRPYKFTGSDYRPADQQTEATNDESITVELNLTTALIRRRQYAAARFYGLMLTDARQNTGRSTYLKGEMIAIGQAAGLSISQSEKGVNALLAVGLIEKVKHGKYRRVGHQRAAELLEIGPDYAPINLPKRTYKSLTAYRRAVTLAVQQVIPANQPSQVIAKTIGISRRTVYNHENALGVIRTTNTRRANPATATVSFVKVFDAQKRFVKTIPGSDAYGALEAAIRCSGSAWGWTQGPSTRILPQQA